MIKKKKFLLSNAFLEEQSLKADIEGGGVGYPSLIVWLAIREPY